jgi:putative N6-adenine-specific DNA methylase
LEKNNQMEFLVKTLAGLENVLAGEMTSLGLKDIKVLDGAVAFSGDLADMYRANYFLRTALSVLWNLYSFDAKDDDELYRNVYDFKWEDYMSTKNTMTVETTVDSSVFPHAVYVTQKVKDAIVDRFTDVNGKRPAVDIENPGIVVNVKVNGTHCEVSLNSSGESLAKRGYRSASGEAPINEVLAAGIILLTGWKGECDFVDPMCGSGTILIEAALIAGNVPPGVFRKQYAFEKWDNFDADLFTDITDESDERAIDCNIKGYDILPRACGITRSNLRSASLYNKIEVEVRDIETLEPFNGAGIVVTNPPLGDRMYPAQIDAIYQSLGFAIKRKFSSFNSWVISANKPAIDAIGLRPVERFYVDNGVMDLELVHYGNK